MQTDIAVDGRPFEVHVGGQELVVAWHRPSAPPAGRPHGAEGICVTDAGDVILVSDDGERWSFPAGRPEGEETWEQTLRREVHEEACAVVVKARLLGYSRGECVAGPERGLVLVRSIWRADVEVGPWAPRFEIRHRRIVAVADLEEEIALDSHPFAPIVRRALQEADLLPKGP